MKLSKLKKIINDVIKNEGDIDVLMSNEKQWHIINSIYSCNISEDSNGVKYCILEAEDTPEKTLKIYFKEKY